jgi:hypothetical protein
MVILLAAEGKTGEEIAVKLASSDGGTQTAYTLSSETYSVSNTTSTAVASGLSSSSATASRLQRDS